MAKGTELDAAARKALLQEVDDKPAVLAGVKDVFWNDCKVLRKQVDEQFHAEALTIVEFQALQFLIRIMDGLSSIDSKLRKLGKS